MYMHPKRDNIPLQELDRRALPVGAISSPYSQIAIGPSFGTIHQSCIYMISKKRLEK